MKPLDWSFGPGPLTKLSNDFTCRLDMNKRIFIPVIDITLMRPLFNFVPTLFSENLYTNWNTVHK